MTETKAAPKVATKPYSWPARPVIPGIDRKGLNSNTHFLRERARPVVEIASFDDWLRFWEAAVSLPELLGLLFRIFSRSSQEDEPIDVRVKRICVLLATADGAHRFDVPSNPEDLYPDWKGPEYLDFGADKSVAEKALDVLVDGFANDIPASVPIRELIVRDSLGLETLLWFLDPMRGNYPGVGDSSHRAGRFREFVVWFVRDAWGLGTSNANVAPKCRAARPLLISMLCRLDRYAVIRKLYFDEEVVEELEKMVLSGEVDCGWEFLPGRRLESLPIRQGYPVKSLKEAVQVDRKHRLASEVLILRHILDAPPVGFNL